ncbi:MAG: M2 family metallopeptidase [Polyangiaceae bacterium]|nr:M2 family metallopeptidase [Polyangiaceae bacterium]
MNRLRSLPTAAAAFALSLTALAACTEISQVPPTAPCPTVTPDAASSAPASATAQPAAPTEAEARAFMTGVDSDLRKLWTQSQRAAWVQANFITDDTDSLSAVAEEANMEYLGRTIKAAQRFEGLTLPADLARQFKLLKIAVSLPPPSDAKDRAELAEVSVWMQGAYGKGKYCPDRLKGKCQDLEQLSEIMAKSRKYDDLLDAWSGWHQTGRALKDKYVRYVELSNKGAKEIGFSDVGTLWRSGYDMPAEKFEQDTDRLWTQVKPLYDSLHCYTRKKLREKYGKEKVAEKAPIPAHLLGNMWAQEWDTIYDLLEPYSGEPSLNVTKGIEKKKIEAKEMVRIAEKFFTSLGMDPLPQTFWERSLLTKPKDREVVCHASAWDVSFNDDLRIKMCIRPTEEDLVTIHHELGHNYYYHYYHKLPILLQQGANDGFHEGIGDTLALSVTPEYLKNLGLIEKVPNSDKSDINFLMKRALQSIAFLPFGKLIDQWRWDVFSGKTKPADYNKAWWELRKKYQGIAPAIARSEQDFDPGAKYHVPANVPYIRYFLARIYQFQFHRALCKAAGQSGPLHKCSIYGSKEAGAKMKALLQLGASKPWPEAMQAITGQAEADATAIVDYFAPLKKWLDEQNKGEQCGW